MHSMCEHERCIQVAEQAVFKEAMVAAQLAKKAGRHQQLISTLSCLTTSSRQARACSSRIKSAKRYLATHTDSQKEKK